MEVILRETPNRSTTAAAGLARSSFDCDGSEIDSILGRTILGHQSLRFDAPHVTPQSKEQPTDSIVRSPLGQTGQSDSAYRAFERAERLARLLARDQAWYEARQKATQEAELSLALLEHQQQSWLIKS